MSNFACMVKPFGQTGRVVDLKTAPDHFVLVLLKVQRVDYLRLARPHVRKKYWLAAQAWQAVDVTP